MTTIQAIIIHLFIRSIVDHSVKQTFKILIDSKLVINSSIMYFVNLTTSIGSPNSLSKATVVIVTHRMPILQITNKLLLLQDGVNRLFGPTTEVMKKLAQGGQALPNQIASNASGAIS